MATQSRKTPKKKSGSKLLTVVTDHPVAAAGIAGAAVIGAIVVKKAVNTAAKVVTIKAAAKGVADVSKAVRGGGSKRKSGRNGKAAKK
jgi:hypothetical protein